MLTYISFRLCFHSDGDVDGDELGQRMVKRGKLMNKSLQNN